MKTGEFPPRIHNLARLAELAALDLTEEERKLLERLSPVLSSKSLSTRNPDLGEEGKQVYSGISIEANGGLMAKAKQATNPDEVIRRAIEHLLQKIRVDQAVLFGSYARGEADEWSDVDLAIISPDFARMSHQKVMDLLVEVALAVDPSVEIRPYTPKDLKEARPTNFLGYILAEGKVVYGDGKFLLING
jgi:uncharacterized protein